MPRYLVERTFSDGPAGRPAGSQDLRDGGREQRQGGVTWIHSYVTPDRKKTFCIYDGPSPEAIRIVAGANGLPVDRIAEVRVLDPYFLY